MRLIIAFTAALFLPVFLMAQQSEFNQIALKIAQANRSPQAAEWSVAGEQASIKSEVAPEDPEVNFAYIWPHDADVLDRWELEITQTLPDFRRRRSAGKVVSALEMQKLYQVQALEAENRYNAEIKLIELIGANKDCELMHSIHENFDSLSVVYRKAWNRGEVTILDLNKIKIEHARADAANLEAEGRYLALVQEIIALSNGTVTADQLLALSDYPLYLHESELTGLNRDMNQNETLLHRLAHSPQFLMMESKLNAARAKVDFASKSRFPQFSLGYKHTYEDGMHFNDLLVGMTLPIWSRKQKKLSAQGEMFALQSENNQAIAEMVAGIKSDIIKAAALKHQLDALGPIVEQTDNVRLLRMALDGGEISLLDYLQEIGYFSEAIREYNAARLDYTLTVASLARYLECAAPQ